jgi:hypothetical protein
LNNAPINEPNVHAKITKYILSAHSAAFRHAGGMITSDGKGMKELSIVIRSVIVR